MRIDLAEVAQEADHLADEAAYGCALPRDPADYAEAIALLQKREAPRDGAAWTKAMRVARARLSCPRAAVAQWLTDASAPDPAAGTDLIADDVASALYEFKEERIGEGLYWKRGNAVGVGNAELRDIMKAVGIAARNLARGLHALQLEARRPGQAGSDRGVRTRALYYATAGKLIDEIARAASGGESDLAKLENLRPRIDVDDEHYVGGVAPIEVALIKFGRWCERTAHAPGVWENLPVPAPLPTTTRNKLVRRLGELWQIATQTPPTCTDAGETNRPSGFVIFVGCAYGHLAGLAAARFPNDDERAAGLLRAWGVASVPSAKTLRKALR